jgi:hypothetical protein
LTESEEEEEIHAQTYEVPRRRAASSSEEDSEEVYTGGKRNDFHTQPKHTPSQSDDVSMYS